MTDLREFEPSRILEQPYFLTKTRFTSPSLSIYLFIFLGRRNHPTTRILRRSEPRIRINSPLHRRASFVILCARAQRWSPGVFANRILIFARRRVGGGGARALLPPAACVLPTHLLIAGGRHACARVTRLMMRPDTPTFFGD